MGDGGSDGAGLSRTVTIVLGACMFVAIALVIVVFNELIVARWLILWLLAQTAVAAIWQQRVRGVTAAVSTPELDLALIVRCAAAD